MNLIPGVNKNLIYKFTSCMQHLKPDFVQSNKHLFAFMKRRFFAFTIRKADILDFCDQMSLVGEYYFGTAYIKNLWTTTRKQIEATDFEDHIVELKEIPVHNYAEGTVGRLIQDELGVSFKIPKLKCVLFDEMYKYLPDGNGVRAPIQGNFVCFEPTYEEIVIHDHPLRHTTNKISYLITPALKILAEQTHGFVIDPEDRLDEYPYVGTQSSGLISLADDMLSDADSQ